MTVTTGSGPSKMTLREQNSQNYVAHGSSTKKKKAKRKIKNTCQDILGAETLQYVEKFTHGSIRVLRMLSLRTDMRRLWAASAKEQISQPLLDSEVDLYFRFGHSNYVGCHRAMVLALCGMLSDQDRNGIVKETRQDQEPQIVDVEHLLETQRHASLTAATYIHVFRKLLRNLYMGDFKLLEHREVEMSSHDLNVSMEGLHKVPSDDHTVPDASHPRLSDTTMDNVSQPQDSDDDMDGEIDWNAAWVQDALHRHLALEQQRSDELSKGTQRGNDKVKQASGTVPNKSVGRSWGSSEKEQRVYTAFTSDHALSLQNFFLQALAAAIVDMPEEYTAVDSVVQKYKESVAGTDEEDHMSQVEIVSTAIFKFLGSDEDIEGQTSVQSVGAVAQPPVQAQLRSLYKHPVFSDVCIRVRGGDVIHVHRVVLMACCPYFRMLLGGPWMEASTGVIDLTAHEPDVIHAIISFLYCYPFAFMVDPADGQQLTDAVEADLSTTEPDRILPIADLFGLGALKKCIEYYVMNVTCHGVSNPCPICLPEWLHWLGTVHNCNCSWLENKFLKEIAANFSKIMSNRAYMEICPKHIRAEIEAEIRKSLNLNTLLDHMAAVDILLAAVGHTGRWAQPVVNFAKAYQQEINDYCIRQLDRMTSADFEKILKSDRTGHMISDTFNTLMESLSPQTACSTLQTLHRVSGIVSEVQNEELHLGMMLDRVIEYVAGNVELICRHEALKKSKKTKQTGRRPNLVPLDECLGFNDELVRRVTSSPGYLPILAEDVRHLSAQHPLQSPAPASASSLTTIECQLIEDHRPLSRSGLKPTVPASAKQQGLQGRSPVNALDTISASQPPSSSMQRHRFVTHRSQGPDTDETFVVGDRIKTTTSGGRTGTVVFVGTVHFAKGTFLGLRLDDESGKHDGTIDGVSYFSTEPNRGIFVRAASASRQPVE
eukprot:Clim_evm17s249 gene=Clim_evmTU17s249